MSDHDLDIDKSQLSPKVRAIVESMEELLDHMKSGRPIEEKIRVDVVEVPDPDPDLADFLARLRRERKRQGLTLAALAERTGIDKADLSRLENGKALNPTADTLRTYARALGKRLVWALADPEPGA